ncbi:transporter substrate-binding domain-containing protein [Moraxella bovis]|uniref:Transporter substrate-binding domain-containing protein n=2 Tax=Moraxella bovis TaxID=476 RepID=A0AAQ2Q587_MORBO|nr:transporter substrate-binding domain-containing protein [Moraxella bovis]AWY20177.1 hypothetical protein DQF64_06505 [Moraxella bovis]OOR87331.1 hypothetical protein B0182_12760 [Moraxella bovis]UYZ67538.1 transporter substrate-binding domain-containing protein [Moraxella bovis]UYZ69898.1 transporter substrate-binding domain-containing protein [Moraxella bovis]UYZ74181.1 transporter substrate-binding domain-containing protein [Moraxella bovis]
MKNFNTEAKYAILPLMLSALMACSDKAPETASEPKSEPAPTATAPATGEQVSTSATVPNAQSYVVGIDANYPPYDFKDENGNAQGFDVDIIKAIAENQGFGVDVVPQDWKVLVKGLDNAQSHIVMSGFSRNDEREAKYLLSNTYAWGQDALAVSAENNSIKNLKDLNGKKVATLADSPYIPQLEEALGQGNPSIIGKPSAFLAFKELATGNAEAVLADEGVLRYYAKQFPKINFKIVGEGEAFEHYEMVIITPKSENELMEKINTGLANIVADGTYAKIYEKWFGVAPQKLPTTK